MKKNSQLVINYKKSDGTFICAALNPKANIRSVENALYAIARAGGEFLGIKVVG